MCGSGSANAVISNLEHISVFVVIVDARMCVCFSIAGIIISRNLLATLGLGERPGSDCPEIIF